MNKLHVAIKLLQLLNERQALREPLPTRYKFKSARRSVILSWVLSLCQTPMHSMYSPAVMEAADPITVT